MSILQNTHPILVKRAGYGESSFHFAPHGTSRQVYYDPGAPVIQVVRRNLNRTSILLLRIKLFSKHAKQDRVIILPIEERYPPLPSFLEET